MSAKTIIVTGANRGIGQAICHLLLKNTPEPINLIATSRSGANLSLPTPHNSRISYSKVDITSSTSIDDFTSDLPTNLKIDVLINNAGVNLEDGKGKGNDYERTRQTLAVNYHGTKDITLSLLPHLTPQTSRIVNLSSVASSLSAYSAAIQARFRDKNATWEDLDRLAEEYLESVTGGRESEAGFSPGRAYNVSKALVNGMTGLLARENPGLIVNACCPGWIATDMGDIVASGRVKPPKTPEQGAAIPVRLALGDIDHVTGRYWANSSVRSKEEGQVQDW